MRPWFALMLLAFISPAILLVLKGEVIRGRVLESSRVQGHLETEPPQIPNVYVEESAKGAESLKQGSGADLDENLKKSLKGSKGEGSEGSKEEEEEVVKGLRDGVGERRRAAEVSHFWNFHRHYRPAKRSLSNKCWSKAERQSYYRPGGDIMTSPSLLSFLSLYSERHRACTTGVKNWTALLLGEELPPSLPLPPPSPRANSSNAGRSDTGGVACQYLVHEPSSPGVGNRLLAVVAAFTYAIVTDRVLLTTDWSLSVMLCQPFEGSQWYLPSSLTPPRERLLKISDLSVEEEKFSELAKKISRKEAPPSAWFELSFRWQTEDQSFFCPEVQERIRKHLTVVTVSTEQYFAVGLLGIKRFRKTIEKYIPDRAVFTHLGRFLLHPTNFVWEKITRLYRMHFQSAARKVGLQVRTFQENDTYAHPRLLECLVNVSQALPPPIYYKEWEEMMLWGNGGSETAKKVENVFNNYASAEHVLLFVTSLNQHHGEFLREAYMEGVASNGKLVNVHSYVSQGKESHDVAQDLKALTEIWLLSFSETLLTSHFSTFGYVAAGLGGRRPYLLNIIKKGAWTFAVPFEENGRPVCELAVSAEPCSHFPPKDMVCGKGKKGWEGEREREGEGEGEGEGEMGFPSYVKPCQDASFGYRVVSVEAEEEEGEGGRRKRKDGGKWRAERQEDS